MKRHTLIAALGIVVLAMGTLQAVTLDVPAQYVGQVLGGGGEPLGFTASEYGTGWYGGNVPLSYYQDELASYFLFPVDGALEALLDNPAVTVTGLSLRAYNGAAGNPGFDGYVSVPVGTPSNTLFATQVTATEVAKLLGAAPDAATFIDLQDVPYGSVAVSAADNDQWVQVGLGGSALSDLDALTAGSTFGVGGYMPAVPIGDPDAVELMFSGSSAYVQANIPVLRISYLEDVEPPVPAIPEPATMALLGGAVVALVRRRRK